MEYASIIGCTKGPARELLACKLKVTENQIIYAFKNEQIERKYDSKHVCQPLHGQIKREINHLKELNEAYITTLANKTKV